MITLAQVKGAIGLMAVLTIAALSWGVKHQTEKLADMRAERDRALTAAQTNKDTAEALQHQRDRDIASLRTLDAAVRAQRDLAAQAIENLEELKRNEAMVQADPHGVRDRINDRLRRLFVDLSCASGRADPDCSGAPAPAGSAPAPADRGPGAGPGDSGRSP